MLGQMMEPVEFRDPVPRELPPKDWATTGGKGWTRPPRLINSIYLKPDELFKHNLKIAERFEQAKKNEVMCEKANTDDATSC